MQHDRHQTTPFRRPSASWAHETEPDPAEVGTAFGLELCLADGKRVVADDAHGDRDDTAAPTLCP